jgi:hypothetical protein
VVAGVLGCAHDALATSISHPVVVAQSPVAWSPQVLDGRVQAIAQVGNTVVVGGRFSQVREPGGATLSRSNLFAFNATTGAIDPAFHPTLTGGRVFTLAAGADGASVYVGGRFTTVNGAKARGEVKLELANGSVDPSFRPRVSGGGVEDSQLVGSRLYLSGSFTRLGAQARTGFAAVDPATGAVDPAVNVVFAAPLVGPTDVTHFSVAPDGSRLVAVGGFTTVNGLQRSQIVMLDLTSPRVAVAGWQTSSFTVPCKAKTGGWIRSVDFSPDSSYFIVGTTGGNTDPCDAVSRWESRATGAGITPTWIDRTGDDSITQVAVSGTAIYVGGHPRWMENIQSNSQGIGAIPRKGVAALDPVNGMPFSWNPGNNPRASGVYAFLVTSQGLWMGSDSLFTGGKSHPRLAFFPAAGGTAVPTPSVGTLPGDLDTIGPGGMTRSSFDGARVGAPMPVASGVDWSHSAGAFMVGHTLYSFTSTLQLVGRSWSGGAAGPAVSSPLYGQTHDIATVTGAFYDPASGRIYYTVSGDTLLYSRLFEPQDGLLGPVELAAPTRFTTIVLAMTRVGNRIYYVSQDKSLYSIGFAGSNLSGAPVKISGSGIDGRSWAGVTGLFVAVR